MGKTSSIAATALPFFPCAKASVLLLVVEEEVIPFVAVAVQVMTTWRIFRDAKPQLFRVSKSVFVREHVIISNHSIYYR